MNKWTRIYKNIRQLWRALPLIASVVVLSACSSSDEDIFQRTGPDEELYAIIVDRENAMLFDIIPSDYVLTLNDIVAYNPETGDMKVKGGDRINEKSYPIPTQYRIEFYSKGEHLFGAWLNNLYSSLIGNPGYMLYSEIQDSKGFSYFKLEQVTFMREDGQIDGEPSDSEKAGLKKFEKILKSYGKFSNDITWDI